MSFLNNIKSFLVETESNIQTIIIDIREGEQVVQKDIDTAIHWLAQHAPAIAADIQQVVSIATQIGVTANPEFGAAVTAANLAVTALNTLATSVNNGKGDAQSVIDGYVAVKQAQAAVSSAMGAAVAAPAKAV